MTPASGVLHARDLVWHAGDRPVLNGVSFAARRGEMIAVSGPSGCGKTTLLSVVGGLLRPQSGEVLFDGEAVWTGDGDPRHDVAIILQVYGLVPVLTALENVAIPLRARGVAAAEAERRAHEALERVHVGDLARRDVAELSGGQAQRVAGARALVTDAKLLLADEPTSELDDVNRVRVLTELRRQADGGAVVVIATHDQAVIETCDSELSLMSHPEGDGVTVSGV